MFVIAKQKMFTTVAKMLKFKDYHLLTRFDPPIALNHKNMEDQGPHSKGWDVKGIGNL